MRSPVGASYQLLAAVADRSLIVAATAALFLEYEEVLKRPAQRSVSGMSLAQVDLFLGGLATVADRISVLAGSRPQLADRDDELVLEAAINGKVDALVTYNVRDFRQAATRNAIRIARPAELLKEIRS